MWEKEIQFGLEFIGDFHQKSRYSVDTIKLNSPTRDLHFKKKKFSGFPLPMNVG